MRLGYAEVLGTEGNVIRNDARHHLVVGMLKDHRHLLSQLVRALRFRGGIDAEHPNAATRRHQERIDELRER